MSLWIECHDTLPDHPKTIRLAKALGVDIPTAIGHLICLWLWVIRYKINGDIGNFSPEEIAHAAKFEGNYDDFMAILIDKGWVDKDDRKKAGALSLHDWADYTKGIRKAIKDRQRKKEQRVRGRSVDIPRNGAVTLPDLTLPNQRGGKKTKSGEKTPPPSSPEAPPEIRIFNAWNRLKNVRPIGKEKAIRHIIASMARGVSPEDLEALFSKEENVKGKAIFEAIDEAFPPKKKKADPEPVNMPSNRPPSCPVCKDTRQVDDHPRDKDGKISALRWKPCPECCGSEKNQKGAVE